MHVFSYLYKVLKEIKQPLQSEGQRGCLWCKDSQQRRKHRGTAPSSVKLHISTEKLKLLGQIQTYYAVKELSYNLIFLFIYLF